VEKAEEHLSVDQELLLGRFVAAALDVRSSIPEHELARIPGLRQAVSAVLQFGSNLGWSDRDMLSSRPAQRRRAAGMRR
jgi:hypothetical protein